MKNLPSNSYDVHGHQLQHNIFIRMLVIKSLYPVYVESASIQQPTHRWAPLKSWVAQFWLKLHSEECPMHVQSDSNPVIEQVRKERLSHVTDRR